MSGPVITVSNLGKKYRISHQRGRPRYTALRDVLTEKARALLRSPKSDARNGNSEDFWALKEVSFEIKQGEVVGIIGRNGAGKSTLLKILSRITEPTAGRVHIKGRVASLLEVGTGFHPELTGRENIFLNGAILGMSRVEIRKKFDEIVAFAEVEKFLDTPVKRYSSGMYVRLAFAVAAYLEPEILIVDEVLAVGDAQFQKKCLGKMGNVAKGGRTVLFVSHNMVAVSQFCSSGIVLEAGKCICRGSIGDAIRTYSSSLETDSATCNSKNTRLGSGELRFSRISSPQKQYSPCETKRLNFDIVQVNGFRERFFVSGLVKLNGEIIIQFDSRLVNVWYQAGKDINGTVRIDHPWFRPGTYTVDFFLCSTHHIIDQFDQAVTFEVVPEFPYPGGCDDGAVRYGAVLCNFNLESSNGKNGH